MNLLEISLKNPIGPDEVIRMGSEIIASMGFDYLIVDVGSYDFVSIQVMKEFRNLLIDLEPCLTKFKKVALIHSPIIIGECSSPNRYNLCISKNTAVQWFESNDQ
jgi:hypothetical protein